MLIVSRLTWEDKKCQCGIHGEHQKPHEYDRGEGLVYFFQRSFNHETLN